jgi:hypothetical protein
MSRFTAIFRSHHWGRRLQAALRVVTVTSLAGGGLWIVGLLVMSAVSLVGRTHRLTEETAVLRTQVTAQENERNHLREQVDWLRTPLGAEELGRKKGLLKPDEHTVRFLVPPPTPVAVAATPTVPRGWGTLLLGLLGGLLTLAIAWALRRRRLAVAHGQMGTLTPRTRLRRRSRADLFLLGEGATTTGTVSTPRTS